MHARLSIGLGGWGLLALVAAGCVSTAPPETRVPEVVPTAVVPEETEAAPEVAPSLAAAPSLVAQVQDAVRYAFGLEAALFAQAEAMTSQEEVAAHFRQGFAATLADDFAAYFWDRDRLRTGDPTLVPPAEVVVLTSEDAAATAYFETPSALRRTWGLPRYTRVVMERRGPRWLVTATSQQDARPR
ncbi:MAG: hypothetical protein AAGF99_04360 [Bacteroidota bacterium]